MLRRRDDSQSTGKKRDTFFDAQSLSTWIIVIASKHSLIKYVPFVDWIFYVKIAYMRTGLGPKYGLTLFAPQLVSNHTNDFFVTMCLLLCFYGFVQ